VGLFLCPESEVIGMPRRPRRGCATSGCPRLAVEGGQYCEEHQRLAAQQYNKHTRSPDTTRSTAEPGRESATATLRRILLCEMCLKEGRLTPVEEVHHILPISQGGDHRESNLMSLCQSCHTKIHLEMGDRQIRG
jgi:5-methylcytosine-specific restriction protein A